MEKMNKLYNYPAIFYKEDDGRYSVIFPDLNHLATYGIDLDDSIRMAIDCLAGYIHSLILDIHHIIELYTIFIMITRLQSIKSHKSLSPAQLHKAY